MKNSNVCIQQAEERGELMVPPSLLWSKMALGHVHIPGSRKGAWKGKDLTLTSRLECSGTIMAYCSLNLLDSNKDVVLLILSLFGNQKSDVTKYFFKWKY
ncbi:hypothetical protein AAY473_015651 [Plecturocebus cupreus]